MTAGHSADPVEAQADGQGRQWLLDVRDGAPSAIPLSAVLDDRLPEIRKLLSRHGAVVLRGVRPLADVSTDLAAASAVIVGLEPIPYREQSSPRTEIGDRVFTATDYPPHAEIFLHNELSYANKWPRIIFFYCARSADQGGATTLADCGQVYAGIPTEVRAAFAQRCWKYVRNLRASAGLSWQAVFQTSSRADAEAYCAVNGIDIQWTDEGARISAVRPATLELSQGPVWFNHIAAFHLSTLPDDIARSLRRLYSPEDLPVHTYFGDGTPIPDEAVDAIRAAYRRASADIHWRSGDLAVIDNQRVAHGRRPYWGARKVFVVLAGEAHRDDEGDKSCSKPPPSRPS